MSENTLEYRAAGQEQPREAREAKGPVGVGQLLVLLVAMLCVPLGAWVGYAATVNPAHFDRYGGFWYADGGVTGAIVGACLALPAPLVLGLVLWLRR